jgi:GGDEF domain-containing protein
MDARRRVRLSSSHMTTVAVGFWGAFFGSVGLMLAGAGLAYARSIHRVALRAAWTALLSAVYVASFIGWLPVPGAGIGQRMLALVAAACSAVLALLLLAWLGVARDPRRGVRYRSGILGLTVGVVAVSWALTPWEALALCSSLAFAVAAAALALCVRQALRGERLAWVVVCGVSCMLVLQAGITLINLGLVQDWRFHAISAVAGVAYLGSFSVALWERYSYLIELREVMAHGPSYDPVTRMRSHAETGQWIGAVFNRPGVDRPVGVIVISIGNLYGLEKLHGRGAMNHALFVCATRLRRVVPGGVEMGRLGEDGFLLLARDHDDPARLVQLARQVAQRLSRPVSLNTSQEALETVQERASWVADVGVGVLAAATPTMRPSTAVSMGRAMSRTAWSFGSRIAWFDRETRQISELPLADAA